MNQSVQRLNELPADGAEAEFLKCCGAQRWAREMAEARPFADLDHLLSEGDRICALLAPDDWLEAFRAHPKIGETKPAAFHSAQAESWSAQEQSAVAKASLETIKELAEKNREYEDRFGFIFIVCATGKSSEEMLALINARIHNDRNTELRTAAEEQRKITQLRLEKLLNQ